LRFSAPPSLVEKFYNEFAQQVAPFILYGSGDFHYLSALWLRRLNEPVVLVSFDNHPDWDIRPPKWGCGGWINRALELSHVQHIAIWGCGNFECWWPHNIFANRSAERVGRLEVHPWADDRPIKDRQWSRREPSDMDGKAREGWRAGGRANQRRGAILQENWRDHFEMFVANLRSQNVYVTIDLDCLRAQDAVTNWENGRFMVADLEWALGKLREQSRIIAGDICGAFSQPKYARWKQRFASEWDHPKLDLPAPDGIRKTNFAALGRLWPALAH
jgi:hypothetical protein